MKDKIFPIFVGSLMGILAIALFLIYQEIEQVSQTQQTRKIVGDNLTMQLDANRKSIEEIKMLLITKCK